MARILLSSTSISTTEEAQERQESVQPGREHPTRVTPPGGPQAVGL